MNIIALKNLARMYKKQKDLFDDIYIRENK